MNVAVLPTPASAGDYAAEWLAVRLRRRARFVKEASVAFSGGSSPVPLLHALAERSVPWKRVMIFQVDERVAERRDPARNRHLLEVLPVSRNRIIDMGVTLPDLDAACRRYALWLPDRLDVVQLGLGADGHLASWVPGDESWDVAAPVAVTGVFNGYRRMTLTPPTINGARHRLLFVTGADKADVLRRLVVGEVDGLPMAHVARTATTIVADEAAASAVPEESINRSPRVPDGDES